MKGVPKSFEDRWVQLRQRTHCREGHELTEANTIIERRGSYEIRRCRACEKMRKQEWYKRKTHGKDNKRNI